MIWNLFPEGFHFENPAILLLIPLVALPIALLLWLRAHRREVYFDYPSIGNINPESARKTFNSSWRVKLYRLRPLFVFVVLSLVIAALARPRVKAKEIIIHREGVDIVIAFDISTSMKAADFKPKDRFTVAKETIKQFIKGRKNDRIGLVVFAGEAYTQVPLTSDFSIILNVLDSIKMGVIEDGTAIGNALALAVNRLRDSKAKSKVVVLLTDGDNNRGNIDPKEAAKLAKEYGIKVYTIQVGKGGLVDYPVDAGMFGTVYQKVEIPVNPALLKEIAKTTGGKYFVATDASALKRIFKHIDSLEKSPLPEPDFVLYTEKYAYFLLPAFLLLLLDVFAGAYATRRIR